MPLPPKLQEIVDDFAGMTREEKLETLIGYAETFPPLPERYHEARSKMEPVPECMTPVFLIAEKEADGGIFFHVDCPPQSPTVRGLASILRQGLDGATPEQVLAVPNDFFNRMGLDQVLSMQRMKGFFSILAHMKRLATEALGQTSQ